MLSGRQQLLQQGQGVKEGVAVGLLTKLLVLLVVVAVTSLLVALADLVQGAHQVRPAGAVAAVELRVLHAELHASTNVTSPPPPGKGYGRMAPSGLIPTSLCQMNRSARRDEEKGWRHHDVTAPTEKNPGYRAELWHPVLALCITITICLTTLITNA